MKHSDVNFAEAYGSDLAKIHDAGFGELARSPADLCIATLQRQGFTTGHIVDLGCGSGILAARLLRAGFAVTGIDLSPAHIALATEKAPEAKFRVGSIFDCEIPPCTGVAAIGECFNYLFDPQSCDRMMTVVLQRIHDALVCGGSLLFDIAEPGRGRGQANYQAHELGEDWAVVVDGAEDPQSGMLTRKITTFCKDGASYRRGFEQHSLRLLSRDWVRSELERIGFRVGQLDSYASFSFPRGMCGFLALKR